MSLTDADIYKIASLSRLELTQTEVDVARSQLNGIFELIEQMQDVDTAAIAPMSHAQEVYQPLREDTVTAVDQREHFQAAAPQTEDGVYLVPKVIE